MAPQQISTFFLVYFGFLVVLGLPKFTHHAHPVDHLKIFYSTHVREHNTLFRHQELLSACRYLEFLSAG
jgi:hypothetical protein